jgi:hypothetical protein
MNDSTDRPTWTAPKLVDLTRAGQAEVGGSTSSIEAGAGDTIYSPSAPG